VRARPALLSTHPAAAWLPSTRPHPPSPPPAQPQRYVGIDQRAPPPPPRGPGFEYRYLTEFQSHEPEFDYLKSLEIEEKINRVRWVRGGGGAKHVISANDKTIKLWKVYEKRVASVTGFNLPGHSRRVAQGRGRGAGLLEGRRQQHAASHRACKAAAKAWDAQVARQAGPERCSGPHTLPLSHPPRRPFLTRSGGSGGGALPPDAVAPGRLATAGAAGAAAAAAAAAGPAPWPLRLPTVVRSEVLLASRAKRVFANAHAYHINSISVNSDQETFLSADDLRVNLWSLEVSDQSFNIVDIKPRNMEDLTEVITAAEFHPQHCNVFAYSSSKGCVRLADMRGAALCDRHAKAYEELDGSQVGARPGDGGGDGPGAG
jgi:serine/threonine-protein phosphatase 2A regulatory subunit B